MLDMTSAEWAYSCRTPVTLDSGMAHHLKLKIQDLAAVQYRLLPVLAVFQDLAPALQQILVI